MKQIYLVYLLFASHVAFSATPLLTGFNPGCANKYCISIRGSNFDFNASVQVRENVPGSVVTEFSGNDIYWRNNLDDLHRISFPIQDLILQSKWESNGLCVRVNNNGELSNELCGVKTVFPEQPKFMGQNLESYNSSQDLEYTSVIVKGDASPLQGGDVLKFMGNSWKQISYDYEVTSNTVLKFDFTSNRQQAEINGVGLKFKDGTVKHFQVYGTQNWGIQDFHDYSGTAEKSYHIPVGEYYRGTVTKMFFTADEDNHVGQNVIFKSPRLEELRRIIDVDHPNRIDDQYMLVFNEQVVSDYANSTGKSILDSTYDLALQMANESASEIIRLYDTVFYGALFINPKQSDMESLLNNNSMIEMMYADIYTNAVTGVNQLNNIKTQIAPVNWGLDRIDQQGAFLDGIYQSNNYDGTGVTVYVFDSGISYHPDFEDRIVDEMSFTGGGNSGGGGCRNTKGVSALSLISPEPNPCERNKYDVLVGGHGTFVAGIIGGKEIGVAKNVNIVSMRVVRHDNTVANGWVISALEWLLREDEGGNGSLNPLRLEKPAVVNMSFKTPNGGGLNQALDALHERGVTLVAASGNDNIEGCVAPSINSSVIAVSATNRSDSRYSIANYGDCVDIYAPGESITSVDLEWSQDSLYKVDSGTSFASPFVAGAAALYLQQFPSASPEQVKSAILSAATPDIVTGIPGNSSSMFLNIEDLVRLNPDDFDDLSVRGYVDDIEGDAVAWPGGANTIHYHNFHDLGDTDWTMVWVSGGGYRTFITEMIGTQSDSKIEVFKFTDVSENPNYPGQNRFIINQMQAQGTASSNSSGIASMHLAVEGGFLYGIRVTSLNNTFGSGTEYSLRITNP